ncbi:hypothetical protein Hdeb2414_s0009g00300731 [Helianthus debilis subsp. tardiflorus]
MQSKVFAARDPCRVVNWERRSLPRSGVPCNYFFFNLNKTHLTNRIEQGFHMPSLTRPMNLN